jgi:hypothetical protein
VFHRQHGHQRIGAPGFGLDAAGVHRIAGNANVAQALAQAVQHGFAAAFLQLQCHARLGLQKTGHGLRQVFGHGRGIARTRA